jgi:type I restriction-modification system DNA methylase subunit
VPGDARILLLERGLRVLYVVSALSIRPRRSDPVPHVGTTALKQIRRTHIRIISSRHERSISRAVNRDWHDRFVIAKKPPPSVDIYDVADRLWETADELRANSHLKAGDYSIPVLGLIFLKFADSRFAQAEAELTGSSTGRRQIGKANYQAKGVLFLPTESRFANLLLLKEGDNLGKAINDAMAAIEEENPSLKGVLPRSYQALTNATLVSLLRSVNAVLDNIEGDAFGKVYEYFLGKFAVAEGSKGGDTSRPPPSSG